MGGGNVYCCCIRKVFIIIKTERFLNDVYENCFIVLFFRVEKSGGVKGMGGKVLNCEWCPLRGANP